VIKVELKCFVLLCTIQLSHTNPFHVQAINYFLYNCIVVADLPREGVFLVYPFKLAEFLSWLAITSIKIKTKF
jgi:hypothetical protein